MEGIFRGEHCVEACAGALRLGKKALVVTGSRSAVVSGALDDVRGALGRLGIDFEVFDGITENPPVEICAEGGKAARDGGCDFVVAAGGGSVIDAGKAIAVFAAQPDLEDIYGIPADFPALPVAAVPLTCGTGSEANRTAVLTSGGRKRSVTRACMRPTAVYLDPRYLETLNGKQLTSTAIDAFCHCLESYLSPKSTAESENYALNGAKILWDTMTTKPLSTGGATLDSETRSRLLDAAYCGGAAIMTTGTGFPHPLGYGLTLRFGTPHGMACGCFTGEYIRLNLSTGTGKERLERFSSFIGTTPEMIAAVIPALSDVSLYIDEPTADEMVSEVSGAKNHSNSPFVLDDGTAKEIYLRLFG